VTGCLVGGGRLGRSERRRRLSTRNTKSANPQLYRELSEPFETMDEANSAVQEFFREVGELRKKYGLPNVYFIVSASSKDAAGEEGQFIVNMMYGDESMAESLVAYSLGFEAAERQERIAGLLKKGGGVKRPKEKK
jgi:hypothetical protein